MLDTKRLLDQFLGAGPAVRPRSGREGDLGSLLQGALGGRGLEGLLGSGGGGIGNVLGGALGGGGLGGALGGGLGGGLSKGAMAAGLAGLLLKGGRKPKKMLGSAVKMGGLALVAGLAYRAYQDYQADQSSNRASVGAAGATPLAPPSDPAFLPTQPEAEQDRARTILRAMIAAAKSDGHVDAAEQSAIFDAVDTLDLDNDDKAFLMDELRAPLDIAAVTRGIEGVEAASEVYLASRIVVAEPDAKERAYLAELAKRLSLPDALVAQLEAQVEAAGED